MTMTGMGVVTKWLSSFPIKVEKKYARVALRAGANAILPDARSRAPVSKGPDKNPERKIKKDIKVRAAKRTRRNVVYMFVLIGDQKGKDKKSGHFYAGHVELGHKTPPRRMGRGVLRYIEKTRKEVKPVKFMEPSFKAKQQSAQQAIRQSFMAQMANAEVAAGITGYA